MKTQVLSSSPDEWAGEGSGEAQPLHLSTPPRTPGNPTLWAISKPVYPGRGLLQGGILVYHFLVTDWGWG